MAIIRGKIETEREHRPGIVGDTPSLDGTEQVLTWDEFVECDMSADDNVYNDVDNDVYNEPSETTPASTDEGWLKQIQNLCETSIKRAEFQQSDWYQGQSFLAKQIVQMLANRESPTKVLPFESWVKEIKRIVGEAMGYASMCWDPEPNGVFQSTMCAVELDLVVDRLLAHLDLTLTTESLSAKDSETFGKCSRCGGAVKVYENGRSYSPVDASDFQIIEHLQERIAELERELAKARGEK